MHREAKGFPEKKPGGGRKEGRRRPKWRLGLQFHGKTESSQPHAGFALSFGFSRAQRPRGVVGWFGYFDFGGRLVCRIGAAGLHAAVVGLWSGMDGFVCSHGAQRMVGLAGALPGRPRRRGACGLFCAIGAEFSLVAAVFRIAEPANGVDHDCLASGRHRMDAVPFPARVAPGGGVDGPVFSVGRFRRGAQLRDRAPQLLRVPGKMDTAKSGWRATGSVVSKPLPLWKRLPGAFTATCFGKAGR